MRRNYPAGRQVLVAISLIGMSSCTESTLKTYPVQGYVVHTDGDVHQLIHSHVELMKDNDPSVHAHGEIGLDGRFTIHFVYEGELMTGAPEGRYLVRLILAEENPEGCEDTSNKLKRVPIHNRFLEFNSSGLSVVVPDSQDLFIAVSQR